MEKTKDVKFQDRLFNARRAVQKQERKLASNTLSPNEIKNAIKNNKIPSYNAIFIGSKGNGEEFTIDDIKAFNSERKATSKKWGNSRGAQLDQLIVASRNIDIQRANTEIKTARLYKIRGDLLHFNVSASGKHKETNYQVRIRLESWMAELTQTQRSWPAVIKQVLKGGLSIDCQCGRYQFWYRYVATAGNYAIAPFEKDFPKVRNPKLNGCCCKHQLKTLAALKSPTVQAQLAKQMEMQSDKAGFSGDNTDKFLNKGSRKQLEKARPRSVDKDTTIKAIQKAKLGFKKQLNDPKYIKNLERKVADLNKKAKISAAKNKALEAIEARKNSTKHASRDQLKVMLRIEIDRAKMYDRSKDEALKVFSVLNKIPLNDVLELANSI